MNLNVVKIGISVVIAVIGWIVGHYFNSRRDTDANRKKLITEYLVDAYRKLNSFACVLESRAKGTESLAESINSEVGNIQLFGTQKQIQLVKEISKHIIKRKEVPMQKLHDLLSDLRNSLRAELGLKSIDSPIAQLYIEYSEHDKSTQRGNPADG